MKTAFGIVLCLGLMAVGVQGAGMKVERHRPCNVFNVGDEVVFSWTAETLPGGRGEVEAVVVDAFGREVLRKKEGVAVEKGAKREVSLGVLGRGYYEATLRVTAGDAECDEKVSFGVMETVGLSTEEFLKEDRRFGLKWWGGVKDKPEAVEMMEQLGFLWTRAIVKESVEIVTNSTLLSTVKIERFPKELFDEARYGAMTDYEAKFGRGSWMLKTVPKEDEYKAWLAKELAKLPANQTVFEIWNEPWDKMSPTDFALLSKWIHEVVEKERPGAKLGPNLRGDMSAYGYDAKVIEAGGLEGMDLVCLHPYATSENREFIRAYRAWISEKVGRPMELYITEYGSHSCPEGPAKRSEVEQAANTTRQSLALYAEDAKALIPHWLGQSERNPTYHEDWFGYIRKNQQPKPVLLAHANAARLIDGGAYLGDLWLGPNVGAMVFRKAGENRVALFTRAGEVAVGLEVGQEFVTVVDLFGREGRMTTEAGRLELVVTPNPVYVCGVADAVVAGASKELRADRWPKPEKPERVRRVAHKMKKPVMDGRFDEWAGATQLYMQNLKVNGDDASGIAYLGWDEEHLYLGVEMRDNEMFNRQPRAKLYRDDSIELFVSTEVRENDAGYGPRDSQFFLTPTSGERVPIVAKLVDREAGVLEDVKAEFFLGKIPKGWAGEVALPWSVFEGFEAKVGAEIALELRVNDSDTHHERWKLDPMDVGFVFVEDPTTWSVLRLEE